MFWVSVFRVHPRAAYVPILGSGNTYTDQTREMAELRPVMVLVVEA